MTNTANTIAARLLRFAATGRRASMTATAAAKLTGATVADVETAARADSGLLLVGRSISLRS